MLADADIIERETARRMFAMVGFRNVAVHQYRALDLTILRAIIEERLGDFETFTKALLTTE